MKWTTVRGISYQCSEEKNCHDIGQLTTRIKEVRIHHGIVRHYGSPSGDFTWKCIAQMIQHGAYTTTASQCPVRQDTGLNCHQPSIICCYFSKCWAPGIPPMYRIKRCVGHFGRFWVIFDELSCIFITFSSICIRQRIWRSLRGCVTGWFLLRPRVTQTFKTLFAVAKKLVSDFFSEINRGLCIFFMSADTIKVSSVS